MSRRVLIVVNHAGFFLSHRLAIALAARDAGFDVHIATPPSRHIPRVREHGLTWHPISLRRSGRNPFAEFKTVLSLLRLYIRLKPDLVHQVTTKPVLYGTLAARLARVPAVVNALAGLGHMFRAQAGDLVVRKAIALAYRCFLRHPRMKIVFQNSEDRATFVERGWVQLRQTALIPGSGVDPEVFSPSRYGVHEVTMVMVASRMLYTKGIAEFVEAAQRVKQRGIKARFVLVGEPDPDNPASIPEQQLRAWAGSGIVEYWGRREDMPDVFRQADVVCLPSFYGEGVPKVLIEGAACGLPLITTDSPGCRDVVTDGQNGLLVPTHDVDALAEAIAVLVGDPELRRQFGKVGRGRAVAEYSLSRVIASTLALYEELLS